MTKRNRPFGLQGFEGCTVNYMLIHLCIGEFPLALYGPIVRAGRQRPAVASALGIEALCFSGGPIVCICLPYIYSTFVCQRECN